MQSQGSVVALEIRSGEGAGQPPGFLGVVLGEEHRGGRQAGVPAVAADREQERVQLPDVLAEGPGVAGQFAVQAGQVPFQELAVSLVQALDAGLAGERGEPGDGSHAVVAGGYALPGADPPPGPPPGEVFEPRLADPAELQGRVTGAGDAQAAQPPGIAGILAVPAVLSFGQGGDLAVRVGQQGGPLAAPVCPVGYPAAPFLLLQHQQGSGTASGERLDDGPDVTRPGPGRVVVAAALQGVLQFQFQLPGQRGQVGPLAVVRRLVSADEPGQVRAAFPHPVAAVDPAQQAGVPRAQPVHVDAGTAARDLAPA